MGKMADFADEWLEHCGYELGYGYSNIPTVNDCIQIKKAYDMGFPIRKRKSDFKPINELVNEYMAKWSVEVEYDKDGGERIIYYKDDDDEK